MPRRSSPSQLTKYLTYWKGNEDQRTERKDTGERKPTYAFTDDRIYVRDTHHCDQMLGLEEIKATKKTVFTDSLSRRIQNKPKTSGCGVGMQTLNHSRVKGRVCKNVGNYKDNFSKHNQEGDHE